MEANTLKFLSLKRKDFKKVLRSGRTFKDGFLVLKLLKNREKKVRLGILISTKFSKKAVVRNKVKRRIREIVRKNLTNFREGFDLIFIPLKGLETDFKSLKEKVEGIFKKTKILK